MFNSCLECINGASINTFDTAPFWGYQQSERVLGAAFRKSILEKRITREEIFVATRAGYVAVEPI
jgi:aryl-alcohol dehydrogenase-like predicted oxidoreductase